MNQTIETPALPGTEQAVGAVRFDAQAMMQEAMQKDAIGRMQNTGFRLEGELVGILSRKVSKKGAVRLSVLPVKSTTGPSLSDSTNLKGADLKAFARSKGDLLKAEACALVSRIGTSSEFTGHSVSLNSAGDRVTVQFRKVESVAPVAEITEAQAMKKLGLDPAILERALAIAREDEEFKRLEAEEAEKIAGSAQSNGEVESVEVKAD